jgi:hypothetical protein
MSCENTSDKKDNSKIAKKVVEENAGKDIEFENSKGDYIVKGMEIAKNSGKTLKGKLSTAVDKGGIESGINTCKDIAQNLMDSLSIQYGVKIKRTSMKLRNVDDKPDQQELSVLSDYHKQKNEGLSLKPLVKKFEEEVRFYAPIFVDDVCLNCHGVIGDKLKTTTHRLIKEYYQSDEAIDYKKGDLRAVWSITFPK